MSIVLKEAVQNGNIDKVKECLNKLQNNIEIGTNKHTNKDLNFYIETALSESIKLNKLEIVTYLVKNYNICVGKCFMLSVKKGMIDIMKFCIEENPELLEKYKRTAFNEAILRNKIEVIKYLIQQGVVKDINCRDGFPLRWSAVYNGKDTVKYLLEQGADIEYAFKSSTAFTKNFLKKYMKKEPYFGPITEHTEKECCICLINMQVDQGIFQCKTCKKCVHLDCMNYWSGDCVYCKN